MMLARHTAAVWLCLLLAGVAQVARADVNLVWAPQSAANRDVGSWQRATDATLVLTGTSYVSSTIVAFGTLAPTDPVYACTADRPVGSGAGCPTQGVYTDERFIPKAQTAVVTAPPPPPPDPVTPAAGPACFPDVVLPARVRSIALPLGVSARYDRVAVWTCQIPTGYRNEVWLFSYSEVADFVADAMLGAFNETAARQKCEMQCTPATDSEKAFADQWSSQFRARAVVRASGTATTRPVYALNADGTRNPTAVAGARVAVGASCSISRRIAGTNYYSVEGQLNAATSDPGDVLGTLYSVCSVTLPIGVNQ